MEQDPLLLGLDHKLSNLGGDGAIMGQFMVKFGWIFPRFSLFLVGESSQ